MEQIELRPIHCASISGGKDSLYMMLTVLNNLDKYPLDCVVHWDLEIDWDWSKQVVNDIEQRLKKIGVPMYRIKPSRTWQELYDKYNMPSRVARWCNSRYKLDCKRQFVRWAKSQNCRPIFYIGFCSDETKRFKYTVGDIDWQTAKFVYPLAEEGIEESTVLEWAKHQPIFKNWYKHFKRQGCKLCPMLSKKELAYMKKNEPDTYEFYFKCVFEWEEHYKHGYFSGEWAADVKKRVETKWTSILEMEEAQTSIFDFID